MEKLKEIWHKILAYIYDMEYGVGKTHYIILSVFIGFLFGACPVVAFMLGYNYERSKEGKADIKSALTYFAAAFVGCFVRHII
ncbi:MAG: hypothetical protein J6I84_04765 [Bacilli bacterium]|nr:hypothetical protein [Bacilli bacterium]